MSQIKCEDYGARHLNNAKVEWLIEYGKIRQNVYFRGAIGDRYTIPGDIKLSLKPEYNLYHQSIPHPSQWLEL